MKKQFLPIALLSALLLGGCDGMPLPDGAASAVPSPSVAEAAASPAAEAPSPSPGVPTPTAPAPSSPAALLTSPLPSAAHMLSAAELERWLPKLGVEYRYIGLAEYGHRGKLTKERSDVAQAVYRYDGVYDDGTGIASKFALEYRVDFARGTVTEKVLSNERGRAEVNSRLHNLVVLRFPLRMGAKWSHAATLNGRQVTVTAEIIAYDAAKGAVRVRYTAGAAGYYDNTYIEERSFEVGCGMVGFSNLMPGWLDIGAADARDPAKLQQALVNHMFGYSMTRPIK